MLSFKKTILLALTLILSLCMLGGCSDGSPSGTDSPDSTTTPSDTVSPSDEASPSDETTPSDEIIEQPGGSSVILTIDDTGMEEVYLGEYMLDGLLFIRLEAYSPETTVLYTEETIVTRIEELEGSDISVISVGNFEELQTSYPTMKIVYQTGANEDTRFCIDMYFATDTNEYRAHTSVPIDYAEEYQEEMIQRLLTVNLAAA